jgi:hypothetical protein
MRSPLLNEMTIVPFWPHPRRAAIPAVFFVGNSERASLTNS